MTSALGARLATRFGKDAVVFGGGGNPDKTLSSEVDLFNVTSKAWSKLSGLQHGASCHMFNFQCVRSPIPSGRV